MPDIFSDYGFHANDPFQRKQTLGCDSNGKIDLVQEWNQPGKIYARKQVSFRSRGRNRRTAAQITEEARIASRLRHRHIIQIEQTYHWNDTFNILIPVADGDLSDFLKQLDDEEQGPARDEMREIMLSWPMCLLRALNYIHEMRVKHRDIKPSNILVLGDKILITDFGISKDIAEDDTTGSCGIVDACTRRYRSPEVMFADDGSRRGRATDIFSLGCVFLEMSTSFLEYPGLLKKLRPQVDAYVGNPCTVLNSVGDIWHLSFVAPNRLIHHSLALAKLAFLMMDPSPCKRITARQLIALTSTARLDLYSKINQVSCEQCKLPQSWEEKDIPLHSIFYEFARADRDTLGYLGGGAKGPKSWDESKVLWEDFKKQWLREQMWW